MLNRIFLYFLFTLCIHTYETRNDYIDCLLIQTIQGWFVKLIYILFSFALLICGITLYYILLLFFLEVQKVSFLIQCKFFARFMDFFSLLNQPKPNLFMFESSIEFARENIRLEW